VVTVSGHWAEDLKLLCDRNIDVITNGFDADDFTTTEDTNLMPGFLFHHIGALNKDRNPHTLWKVLGELCKENNAFKRDLKLKFTGKTDAAVFESLKEHGLFENAEKTDYMAHSEVVKLLLKSPVLLLPLNDTPNILGIVPGKLFEYLAAKRPIFAIGNVEGDTAKIIADAHAGTMVGFKDEENTKKRVLELYEQFNKQILQIDSTSIEKYSRRSCAESYTKLLNEIVG
jgi:glycosyltransferase involved in cell wall biosynthesis